LDKKRLSTKINDCILLVYLKMYQQPEQIKLHFSI
jgi:hypothetical protein